MQYYSFNINDYTGSTAHLDPIEDIAYRRLIDLYYQTEAPITSDMKALAKRIRLREHMDEIQAVLDEFFIFDDENQVYRNQRCEKELAEMYEKSEKARKSAAARWAKPKKAEKAEKPENKGANANAMRTHSERNATHNPIPNNTTINQSACEENFVNEISDGMDEREVEQPTFAAEAFAMHLNWQPADENALALLLRQARLPALDSELFAERLAEFKLYWVTQPAQRTESEWVHTLVQSLLHAKNTGKLNRVAADVVEAKTGTVAVVPAAKGQSATAKSRDCLRVAKQAVLGGQAQTATATAVFAAVVDGLLDCLGHGFAYPPAADAWDVTLKTWDAEFAKLRLNNDEEAVKRVQTAFAVTVKAVLKSENRVFPKVNEVLANMPMRMVAKAIEKKMSDKERAASELSRQQALRDKGGLGKILKGKVA